MIKAEWVGAERLSNGVLDAGVNISIVGDVHTVAVELANLITCVSDRYSFVLDLAMKYIEDNNKYREDMKNDKTDISYD